MSHADDWSLYDAATASVDACPRPLSEIRRLSSHRSRRPSGRVEAESEAEAVPSELGDYRIVREIGRGGMGVVYEARQLSLGRTIALKVLPFAAVLDAKQVARFQNEAQAAAQLHHPNIVPVFGVGCDRGVHYYSMQLIDGQPLDQAIAELRRFEKGQSDAMVDPQAFDSPPSDSRVRPPSTTKTFTTKRSFRQLSYIEAAVNLIVQAAEALHHAHESGIIHRDIKPSNLLVDKHGKLWVADFGLARCQTLTGLTAAGDVFGTLRYMSPEQATGQNALVDHRSDLYALGVTLYELLTLKTPFHAPQRLELLRQIAHDEPPSPRTLNPAIPLDLETIILKTLSKSREDRYETTQAFADDLRCFLAGQPTLARRPSTFDRMGRVIRKRSKEVAAVGIIMGFMLSFSCLGTFLVTRAHLQTREALAESQRHLQAARRTVDDFNARFSDELATIPGTEVTRLAALQRAGRFYEEYLSFTANEPRWRADVAIATFKNGHVLEQLGDLPGAQNAYELALRRFDELLPDIKSTHASPASKHVSLTHEQMALQVERAMCWNNLALLLARKGQKAEALSYLERAQQSLQALVMTHHELEWRHDLVRVQANLGSVQQQLGETVAAKQWLTTAIESARDLAIDAPEELNYQTRLASALHQLSVLSTEPEEACEPLAEAVSLYRQLLAKQPHSPRRRSDLVHALQGWGSVQAELKHTDCARGVLEEAVSLSRELIQQAPRVPGYRADLAAALNNLGMTWVQEDVAQAKECFAEAANALAQSVQLAPKDFALRSEWAITLSNEAMAEERLNHLEAALVLFNAAIDEQTLAFEGAGKPSEIKNHLDNHRTQAERVRRKLTRGSDQRTEVPQARSRS